MPWLDRTVVFEDVTVTKETYLIRNRLQTSTRLYNKYTNLDVPAGSDIIARRSNMEYITSSGKWRHYMDMKNTGVLRELKVYYKAEASIPVILYPTKAWNSAVVKNLEDDEIIVGPKMLQIHAR
ncbi:hypothetical protein C5167_042785 [Papaver somniferum]|uniref:Uncharacterized protein n=1 Tax=Papaver somniferum TaxID=3469 RepID=A0A4Y7L5J0_PAPSO|nr:hypothetical protein C5167_042785 [Papaver somniferum]